MKYYCPALALGAVLFAVLAQSPPDRAPAGIAQVAGPPAKKQARAEGQVEELRAEIKKLQDLLPDQAAVMTHVGYHWSNLWFAIDQENWPLADFYLSETRNNIKWAVRTRPFRQTSRGEKVNLGGIAEALDNTEFKQMKEAIARKDKDRCVKLYNETLTVCYACHNASEKTYLRPRRPAAPEVRVINFDPKAKDPVAGRN